MPSSTDPVGEAWAGKPGPVILFVDGLVATLASVADGYLDVRVLIVL